MNREYLFVLSLLIDFSVAISLLLLVRFPGGTEPLLTIRRVTLTSLFTGIIFLLKLPFLMVCGVDSFGVIRIIYLDLVLLIPAIGLLLIISGLLRSGRPGSRHLTSPVWLVAWASLVMAPVGVYSSFVEPFRLQVEESTLSLREGRSAGPDIRIGVLADLQTDRIGDHEREAVDRLLALEPDIILLPGDLFQGTGEEFQRELPALRALLQRLRAPGGVYLTQGNTDGHPKWLHKVLEGSQVRFLFNEQVTLTLRGREVTLLGLSSFWRSTEAVEAIRELENAEGESDLRILISHFPDAVYRLQPHSRVDLVVSGHTHGGQIQLPFIGPPLTLTSVPRKVAAGGLHEVQGNRIYVSRGVGCERLQAPRIRFLCPPEISLLTLSRP